MNAIVLTEFRMERQRELISELDGDDLVVDDGERFNVLARLDDAGRANKDRLEVADAFDSRGFPETCELSAIRVAFDLDWRSAQIDGGYRWV